MAKKDKDEIMLAEQIMEVRHNASGSFLDVRGFVADYIHNKGLFPHWKIDSNLVNFRDLPNGIEKQGAFAGYKNAGFLAFNPDTSNYFVGKANAFWRHLLKNGHYKVPAITRFGVRTKVFVPSKNSFDQLNKKIFEIFYTPQARELIGGQEKDVQFMLDLTEDQFEVRLSGGPMHKNEVGKFFNFDSDKFECPGLFLDLDYSKAKKVGHEDVPNLLKNAIDLTWIKVDNIANALEL